MCVLEIVLTVTIFRCVKYSLVLIQDFLRCRLGSRYVLLQLKHAASLEVLTFTKRKPVQNH